MERSERRGQEKLRGRGVANSFTGPQYILSGSGLGSEALGVRSGIKPKKSCQNGGIGAKYGHLILFC